MAKIEKLYNDIANFILLIVLSPLILIIIVLLIPVLLFGLLFMKYESLRDKSRLKKLIKSNDQKIFFVYADYNEFDFDEYFRNNHSEISLIKITNRRVEGLLFNYLIKNCKTKCYPRLVKIRGRELIHKEHYNSFKNLVKRNKNYEEFYNLLDASIKNLKRL